MLLFSFEVLCASAVAEEQMRNTLLNPDRFPTLPADLTSPLCTEEQEKWYAWLLVILNTLNVVFVKQILLFICCTIIFQYYANYTCLFFRWLSAYKMYRKEVLDDIGDTRQNLQRGLEVIRCIGNHGLNPIILVHLARIFNYRVGIFIYYIGAIFFF